jgi:hypothetical protein
MVQSTCIQGLPNGHAAILPNMVSKGGASSSFYFYYYIVKCG